MSMVISFISATERIIGPTIDTTATDCIEYITRNASRTTIVTAQRTLLLKRISKASATDIAPFRPAS